MSGDRRTQALFLGSDSIAVPLLELLFEAGTEGVALAGVMTQPDRPAGRGKQLTPNAIKRWALERDLPVWQPEKPGAKEEALLRELGIELVLVMAYGHLLRRSFLETPARGTFNLHTSLLPAYRGASPIQAAVASGDRETGVSLMRMVPGMDAGPVVDSKRVPVGRTETALDVEAKLAQACVPLVSRNLADLLTGTARENEQDERRATYSRKLVKADGVLDFSRPAETLAHRVNALYPWPGVRVMCGETPVRAGRADWDAAPAGAAPGTILGIRDGGLGVATGEGALLLLALQRPGGRMLSATDFLRGFPIAPGAVLPSQPMPELVRPTPFPGPRRSGTP